MMALVLSAALLAGCGGGSAGADTSAKTEEAEDEETDEDGDAAEASTDDYAEDDYADEGATDEYAAEAATEEYTAEEPQEAASQTASSESGSNSENVFEKLKSVLTYGYAGADQSNAKIYWAVDKELTNGLFVDIPADGSEPLVMGGEIIKHGDGNITLTDTQSGQTLDLKITQDTDNEGTEVYMIEASNGAIGALYEVPAENVLDAMSSLANGNQ